jgi:succinate-semialdehyde dehydrogenase/glutarate-semialdehyde dehydrogenase
VEPGDPEQEDTTIGPLSSTTAADRLEQQVKLALDNGAKLAAGGGREGNFFKTAVLTDITPDNPAYREEFFGPVAQVYKVGSEEEAVRLANDTPYGLGSYVFTTDDDQALRVADQIEAGMVFINAVGAEGVELPFGGVKASGFGRELGTFGTEEFVNKKLIRVGG